LTKLLTAPGAASRSSRIVKSPAVVETIARYVTPSSRQSRKAVAKARTGSAVPSAGAHSPSPYGVPSGWASAGGATVVSADATVVSVASVASSLPPPVTNTVPASATIAIRTASTCVARRRTERRRDERACASRRRWRFSFLRMRFAVVTASSGYRGTKIGGSAAGAHG